MTGEGENQTRKFTDKEIKRIIEFNNVIKENTPSKKETEENKNE